MWYERKMPRHLRVVPHLPHEQVVERFRESTDVYEKQKWQAVMLVEEGWSTADIASICKRSETWVRTTIYTYNEKGADGLSDKRAFNGNERYLSDAQLEELRAALSTPPPSGGIWTGAKVSRWIEAKIGRAHVNDATGWDYLQRLGWSPQVPRPKHPDADTKAQDAFKKGGLPTPLNRWPVPIPPLRSKSGPKMKPVSD